MCGITGFLASKTFNHSFDQIILDMTQSLQHRGPDDFGLWSNKEIGIALGHQRLSIVDLSSSGQQPMVSNNQRYVIVFNGEIYNFLELKEHLSANNYTFKSHSDTEVILFMLSKFGIVKTIEQLTGMFAIAIWDEKDRILYLARDRFGEKPLYYGVINDSFVFASELKALKKFPCFKKDISQQSLYAYLQYGYVPSPNSIYNHIYKLPPGTMLSIPYDRIDSKIIPEPYWSSIEKIELHLSSRSKFYESEHISNFESKLNAVVQKQMVADVPIGSFLSGGIDSSLITAIMQKNSSNPIQTFTIGFHEHGLDEAGYAKKIANYLSTQHTELYINGSDALNILPKLSYFYDEPFADSSAIPTMLVSELAQKSVKICLSGDGGDELFGGYNRYLLGEKLWKLLQYTPHPIQKSLKQLLLNFENHPKRGHQFQKLALLLSANSPQAVYQCLISQCQNPNNILNTSVFQNSELLLDLKYSTHLYEQMMATDTMHYLPDDVLVKVDRASMAFGLEIRAPFLDHQLFELSWNLPHNLKIQKNQTKLILRHLLLKHLPKKLFERPKMGFGIPLASWLRTSFKDWGNGLIYDSAIEYKDLLNYPYLSNMWEEHQNQTRNWQYQIWPVLILIAWFRENKI